MKKYFTCAETAKLVRQSLKEAFPGVKFSVKSKTYSGGASINVGWTNGPTSKQVSAIVKRFEGSYFDGMSDYKGLNYSAIDGQEVRVRADDPTFVRSSRGSYMVGAGPNAVVSIWYMLGAVPATPPCRLVRPSKSSDRKS